MLSNILLVAVLLLRVVAPVAAMPQFIRRDGYCTATVTVYSSADGSLPTPSPSMLNIPQTVTVISTVTILSTLDSGSPPSGVNNLDPSPQTTAFITTYDENAAKTVTVLDTTTIFSTIYASLGSGDQQITDSPSSGGPQTVTVTFTSFLTPVETQTLVQTQTITQNRTVVQTETVTPTFAQANSVETAVDVYADPDGTFVTYTTVTSTFTTTLTTSIPVSGVAVAPQPTIQPPYINGTEIGQYRNSSNSISSVSSARSLVQSISALPPASTSVPPISTPSETPSYPSYPNSSSSGYENGLYFVNWFVSPTPIYEYETDIESGASTAQTSNHSLYPPLKSLASTTPSQTSAATAPFRPQTHTPTQTSTTQLTLGATSTAPPTPTAALNSSSSSKKRTAT